MLLDIIFGAAISILGFQLIYEEYMAVGRSPKQKERRSREAAARQVDDLFDEARIRMEEAAGRRKPGERRLWDGLGSWQDW